MVEAAVLLFLKLMIIYLQAPGMPVSFIDIIKKRPLPRTMTTHLNSKLMSKAIEKGKPKVGVHLRDVKYLSCNRWNVDKCHPYIDNRFIWKPKFNQISLKFSGCCHHEKSKGHSSLVLSFLQHPSYVR